MLTQQTDYTTMSDPTESAGFIRGTLVETVDGPKPIEDIAAGDMIITSDNGAQPVRFLLRQTVDAAAPILFEAGSIENSSDLIVSPEHRMLIADWRAELVMGCDEVLVTARHLVNGKDVRALEGGTVEFLHLLFDAHQIIFVNGCAAESCLPDARFTRHGVIQSTSGVESIFAARPVARSTKAACLMAA